MEGERKYFIQFFLKVSTLKQTKKLKSLYAIGIKGVKLVY